LSGKEKPDTVVNRYVADDELKHHIALFEAAFPKWESVGLAQLASPVFVG
jgi:hypothetical protein